MMSTLPSEELSGFTFSLYYWQPLLNFEPASCTSVSWDRPPASRPSRSQALPRSPKPLSSWSRSVRRARTHPPDSRGTPRPYGRWGASDASAIPFAVPHFPFATQSPH